MSSGLSSPFYATAMQSLLNTEKDFVLFYYGRQIQIISFVSSAGKMLGSIFFAYVQPTRCDFVCFWARRRALYECILIK